MRRPLRAASSWGAFVVAYAASAHADSAVALVWQAPLECPSQAALVAQTESFLGRRLDAPGGRALELAGQVRADAARGFVAQLRLKTSRGTQERELSHRDCAELTEAAALIVALAIDPRLVLPEKPKAEPPPPPAAPAPAGEPAPPPSEPVADPPVVAPPPPPALVTAVVRQREREPRSEPKPLRFSLSALGLFGSSVLPGAGIGAGAQAALGPERFRLALQGAYWLSRFHAMDSVDGPGVELGTWSIALKGCGLPRTGDVAVALCFGPVVGDMYGTGSGGLTNARTVHDHWSALAAEASVSVSSSTGVTTLLGVELQKTLEAPRFGITTPGGERELFEARSWAINGFIGLGVFR